MRCPERAHHYCELQSKGAEVLGRLTEGLTAAAELDFKTAAKLSR